MEIIEIARQKSNNKTINNINKYKVKFILHDNTYSLLFFEEVLLDLKIFKPGNISEEKYLEMVNLNRFYEGFYEGIKYLKLDRTKNELIEHLRKKDLYDEKIIKKIEDLKLLDDLSYSKKYIELIKSKGKGRKFAEQKFLEKKLSLSLLNYSLSEERTVMEEVINKNIRIGKYKKYSNQMAKLKLKTDLLSSGFSLEMIDNYLFSINFKNDDSVNIKKDFEVALKKYPKEKDKQIKYLLRKGYFYEDIKKIGGVEND